MSDIVIQIKTDLIPVNPAEVQKMQQQLQQQANATKPVSFNMELIKPRSIDSVKEYRDEFGKVNKVVGNVTDSLGRQLEVTAMLDKKTQEWYHSGTKINDQMAQRDKIHGQALAMNEKIKEQSKAIGSEQSKWFKQSYNIKEIMDDMTRTPDALVKMRQHYQDLSKETNSQQKLQDDFNKRNMNAIDYEIKQRETQGQQFSKGLQARLKGEEQVSANISKQGQMLEKISNLQKTYAEPLKRQDLQQTSDELNKMTKEVQNLDTSSKSFNKELGTKSDRLKVLENDTKRVNMQMKQGSHFVQIFGQSIFEAGEYLPLCGEPVIAGCAI